MLYVLKRKDEIVTLIDFLEYGNIYRYNQELLNPELAPLHDKNNHNWLKDWWKRRAVPINQGHIREFLNEKGFSGNEEYLLDNLGLSLISKEAK